VSEQALRGWFFYLSVLIGFTICIPVFMMGPQLASQIGFVDLALSVYIGGFLLAVIACCAGSVGVRTQLPTPVIIQTTFGHHGSILVIFILSLTFFGWFGVQAEVFARSFVTLIDQIFSVSLPVYAVILISALLMSSTAIIGIQALGRLSYLSVPLLTIILVWPLFSLIHQEQGLAFLTSNYVEAPLSLGMIASIVVGGWMVGASVTPDLARFQKDLRSMAVALFLNYAVFYPSLILLTATLSIGFAKSDFIQIMMVVGLAVPTLFVLFFATWTTNDKNLYESSLAVSSLFPTIPRWKVTAIAGLCGTGFALLGLTSHFIPWLIFLGIFIAPLAGIYVIDFWQNKDLYTRSAMIKRSWRLKPFVIWGVGAFVGLLSLPASSMGLGLLTLTHIPALDALLVSALTMLFAKEKIS
jgi:cytosine permease